MFSWIWHTFFFNPIYNGLIFFIDLIPGGDVGVAIILTTIVVKAILLPLSIKAAKTQKVIKEIDPKIRSIKEEVKDPQEQAVKIMALYKDAGINPFASILLMFVQIPILISLYLSVYSGGGIALPNINVDLLYAFVPQPETASMLFLGMLNIAEKSLPLAILAGVTQFFHGQLAFPKLPPRDSKAPSSMKEDFGRNMQLQMKYFMPILIAVVAYSVSAAIALYFIVSSLTMILQELALKKHKS